LRQYQIEGKTSRQVADGFEAVIRDGGLSPGEKLPTVRALAAQLGASPATVATAYRTLQDRGLVVAAGRSGTRVAPRPPLSGIVEPEVPEGVRDLRIGLPDAAFLPDPMRALTGVGATDGLATRHRQRNDPELLRLAAESFAADGVDAQTIAVVSGALDGIERVLQTGVSTGDAVAVEDPLYPPLLDLLRAMGLRPLGVGVDDEGMRPDRLESALARGARAVVVTPRAQNPTGAALAEERARELRAALRDRDVLLIEDDHAGPVAGAPQISTIDPQAGPWALVRSVSKSLGPDLRLAVVAGDETTIARLEGRQALGAGWVSTILQRTVAAMWSDPSVVDLLDRAADAYAARRAAVLDALAAEGLTARGRSGLNVWLPVQHESATVESLLQRGWAVAAGERFRLASPPAIRLTVAALEPTDAPELARAIASAAHGGTGLRTY
jgi:DNA-binding transcriptional MocR family regulator